MPCSTANRVVITGLGLHCAAGSNVAAAWRSILAGESHVDNFASSLDESWPGRYFAAGQPVGAYHPQLLSANEAVKQSGLSPRKGDSDQSIGFVFGASKGLLNASAAEGEETRRWLVAEYEQQRLNRDDSIDSPYLVAEHPLYPWPPTSAGNDLRAHLKLEGPATCPVAACASGLIALIQAAQWIEWGTSQSVIAGSADNSLTPSVLATYRRLGVLSKWHGDPSSACRPFDRDRSGFVIGEGAGVLALESEGEAIRRGATPLAVFAGYDQRTDPTGLIESDREGEVIGVVISNAIQSADLDVIDVDAICCHGTGTVANDRAEAIALRRVFGVRLNDVPCFSFKGAIGHTLGASGSIETALCVMALRDQVVPPHLHADYVDPTCPIGPLPKQSTPMRLRHVLKLSYGFGGHVAAAVISHPDA